MAQLKQKYGEALAWEGIGVTGSGRYYIAEKTGASTATISRVNRSLNYGNDGYEMVFSRLSQKHPEQE